MGVQSLGLEDPLEEGMATHSSILAWKIPWTMKPGRLYSPWDCKRVVVQLLNCVRLCDPMDCSMSGFPVLHHLPELAQTHVH